MLFLHSCRSILHNPGVNPIIGLLRHSLWHLVRSCAPLPLSVPLTALSKLVLHNRSELNGCAALAWGQRLYDYNNMSFVRHLTAHPEIVSSCFDVGGNLGIYALLMSEQPNTRVTCFEPHPETARTLERVLEANNRTQVQVIQKALSNTEGDLHLTDDPCNAMNKVTPADLAGSANTISIQATTGAAVCEALGHAPDLMKVDTEGHEDCVLQGFGPWLAQIKLVLIEENLPTEKIRAQLSPHGFIGPLYVDFTHKRIAKNKVREEDALYLNKTALPALQALGYEVQP